MLAVELLFTIKLPVYRMQFFGKKFFKKSWQESFVYKNHFPLYLHSQKQRTSL